MRPEYNDQHLLQRLLTWLERRIDATVSAASGTPSLTWLAITAIALGLGVALVLLLSRARRSARLSGDRRPVLTEERLPASALRARAERALEEGRYGDAVLDGYRALVLAQAEAGRLDDAPAATAHEVAEVLAAGFVEQRGQLVHGADLFDAVRYGERAPTRDQAVEVLSLDEALRSRR